MIENWDRHQYWEKSQITHRPYEAYELFLGFKVEDLHDKDILDLGSGGKEEFGEGIKEKGIKARVISVNPKLGSGNLEGAKARSESTRENVVAAIAQELPFKNKSFDLIMSLDAVPLYLSSKDETEYLKSFTEMDRILRDGGIIKIYPIRSFEKEPSTDVQSPLTKSLQYLERKGYNVFWKKIEVEDDLMKKYMTTGGWQLTLEKPKNQEI